MGAIADYGNKRDEPGRTCRSDSRVSSPVKAHVLVLALLIVLSAVLTYPLLRNLNSHILGPPAPGDNYEYLYKVWWFKHALFDLQGVSPFFNPGMFYPFGYPVTLSETTLANTIPALPLTLLFGEVISYNLTLWVSFVLSGWGMYLLVLSLTRCKLAGLVSGVVFAFCPYRMSHLGAGHLPLMGTQWLPFLLLYLERMITLQRKRDGVLAALFFALSALSAWYYAYISALAGLLYIVLRGRPWRERLRRRSFISSALTFAVLCTLLVGPFALPLTQLWKEGSRPQSLRYVDTFSASPLDFVFPNVLHPLWGNLLLRYYPQNVNENVLYLGLVPLVLSAAALWPGWHPLRKRNGRREEGGDHHRSVRDWGWLSLIFFVLALGTTLHWRDAPVYISVPDEVERLFTTAMGVLTKRVALYPISSYSLRVERAIYVPMPTLLLYLFLPFFRAMRVWTRLGLITILSVAVLTGFGFYYLCRGRSSIRNAVLAAVVLVLVAVEFAALPYALGTSKVQARPVDAWLAQQEGDFAILELPLHKAVSGPTLYAMRLHGKKIASGYGTFFPRSFEEQRAVLAAFPRPDSLALLRDWGVRYVLVGARSYGAQWPQLKQECATAPALRHVLTVDDAPVYEGDRVLRLLPGTERAFLVDRIYVYEVLR